MFVQRTGSKPKNTCVLCYLARFCTNLSVYHGTKKQWSPRAAWAAGDRVVTPAGCARRGERAQTGARPRPAIVHTACRTRELWRMVAPQSGPK